LENYLEENQEKFRVSNSSNIEYIQFSLTPNPEDSAATISEIQRLTEELKNAESDSVFANRNSEGDQPFRTIYPGDPFPPLLASNVEEPEKGAVYGPYLTETSSYITFKISE